VTAVATELDVSRARVTRALNLFQQSGAVTSTRRGFRWDGHTDVEQAVATAGEVAAQHRRVELTRVEMMRGYAETTGCRRQFLMSYFGDELQQPCGACDTCAAGSAEDLPTGETGFAVQSRVLHAEWGPGIVMREEDDRLTVLFDAEGYRTLSLRAVRDNNLLTLRRASA
jgi:ATP-dependent DNA helicase RecQ